MNVNYGPNTRELIGIFSTWEHAEYVAELLKNGSMPNRLKSKITRVVEKESGAFAVYVLNK